MLGFLFGLAMGSNRCNQTHYEPYVPPPRVDFTPEQWKAIAENPKMYSWALMEPTWRPVIFNR